MTMPRQHREFSVDATGYHGEEEEKRGSRVWWIAFMLGLVAGLLLGLLLTAMP